MVATPKNVALLDRFNEELVLRADKVRSAKPKYETPTRSQKVNPPKFQRNVFNLIFDNHRF